MKEERQKTDTARVKRGGQTNKKKEEKGGPEYIDIYKIYTCIYYNIGIQ